MCSCPASTTHLTRGAKPYEMNTVPCYVSNVILMSPNSGSPGPSQQWDMMQLPTPRPCPATCRRLEAQSLKSCPQPIPRKRERCDKLLTTAKQIYPLFIRHGHSDHVDAGGQLNSWETEKFISANASSKPTAIKTPSPHALTLAFSQLFLIGNTSTLITHHKCIKCSKDVYIKQQTTDEKNLFREL